MKKLDKKINQNKIVDEFRSEIDDAEKSADKKRFSNSPQVKPVDYLYFDKDSILHNYK